MKTPNHKPLRSATARVLDAAKLRKRDAFFDFNWAFRARRRKSLRQRIVDAL